MRAPSDTFDDERDLEVEVVPLALPLDRATVSWLIKLTGGSDTEAAELIASMIRAIREDDERSNQTLH